MFQLYELVHFRGDGGSEEVGGEESLVGHALYSIYQLQYIATKPNIYLVFCYCFISIANTIHFTLSFRLIPSVVARCSLEVFR